MLDATIKTQLAAYLERLQRPIELVATLGGGAKSRELAGLLREIAALSPRVVLREDGHDARAPSFSVGALGEVPRVRFAGIPLGHEFSSLVLALLQVGGHPPRVTEATAERVRALVVGHRFEVFVSLSCHNCPDVVQALNTLAVLNPGIECTMIDGALFQPEVEARQVMAVPSVFVDGKPFGQGRMSLDEILAKIDTGSAAREAAALAAREPYDVLIVGGGPAGAAAALYAARKGIRTGIVAERFGGQVMDTLAIENLVSVPHTEGPKLGAALEEQVRELGADVVTLQRAEALEPAGADGLARLRLANGATLRARSLVLAPGARWRELGVPGEQEYKARGVCFCPHCDGPLFKGRRVAVIGGGNSGVEAAIDLAGIVVHVTLIEFDDRLRADAVLQARLASLPNVRVITGARTTEVLGDGQKLTGLVYEERASGTLRRIELEGIFVQIGLLPSTDWLKGAVELTPRGEIVVDARGQTSLPGVFAAGDATTVPFKQIVVAMGQGATASLAAFEHLIRTPLAQTAITAPSTRPAATEPRAA
jgi:alkyl hydroperoxide reductase subunit F